MSYSNRYATYRTFNEMTSKTYNYTTTANNSSTSNAANSIQTNQPVATTSAIATSQSPSRSLPIINNALATTNNESSVTTTLLSPNVPRLPSPVTDILHAEVDYNVNEVDNIMICKGKIIEVECRELSSKHGLISKCLFLNSLLKNANLAETNLESDPLFVSDSSKAIIKFKTNQDAEEFINSHNSRFRIILKSSKASNEIEAKEQPKAIKYDQPLKSSVNESYEANRFNSASFPPDNTKVDHVITKPPIYSSSGSNSRIRKESNLNEPISGHTTIRFNLNEPTTTKQASSINDSSSAGTTALALSKFSSNLDNNNTLSIDAYKGESNSNENFSEDGFRFESTTSNFNDGLANENTNSFSLKRNQVEGYETLTIRAKLKQRVGPNRTNQVTLKDIDSIMRNVVTIVQNEFMKRFPSASAVNSSSPSYTESIVDNFGSGSSENY